MSFNSFVGDLNVVALKNSREWLSNTFNVGKDRKVLLKRKETKRTY